MWFQIMVKVVSVKPGLKAKPQDSGVRDSGVGDSGVRDFVEQMGGYFESNGLTRLAGRLLGWLCWYASRSGNPRRSWPWR